MSSSDNQMLMYMTEDGLIRIEVHLQDDTVWLNKTSYQIYSSEIEALYPSI